MSATLLSAATLAAPSPPRPSTAARRASRVMTGVAVLFLAWDTAIKLVPAQAAVDGTAALGFTARQLPTIGLIELACLALFVVPRTAVLGAVLWTGYFGGAIVTHLRVGNPLLSHILFPIYVAALLWGGLYLRDARVRAMLGAAR